MTKIQLLPDQIIDKIAAGEVVERPASVVKELVENSIDAGADVIEIILEDAGKEQITIVDNGGGMAKEDLLLAVKRHATSKIISVDDLYSIHTMGFRGEALASIASVSDLHIASKLPSGSAWKLCCTAGEVVDLHETHASGIMSEHGTLISIKNLFYNVPARLKFLKSSPAEFSAIVDIIEGIALVNPHLKISLKHNGKNVSHFERVENPRRHSPKKGEAFSPDIFWRRHITKKSGANFWRRICP